MENGIFVKLNDMVRVGKKTHKRIAEFLLSYEGDFRTLKIVNVATAACTSNATVVRFAKELGFIGFPEMKIELENQSKIYQGDDYSSDDNHTQDNHLKAIKNSLDMTKNSNTYPQILNCVNKIKNAKNIDIYAKGETNIVAQDFTLKLIRIGHVATSYQDSHTQHFVATNSSSETVALGITFSGTTNEVLESLKLAKKYGATTFLISKTGVKKPAYVDFILNVSSSESGARVFSTASRFAILYLLDVIYLELIESDSVKYYEKLNKTRIKGSR